MKDKDTVVGNQTKVKVVKNKLAPPFRVVEFDIMYGEGISKMGEILDLGVNANIVEKSGAWFSYNGERIGQGREQARKFLKDNPQISNEIERKIRENSGTVAGAMLAGQEESDNETAGDNDDGAPDEDSAVKGKKGKAAAK